MKFQKLVIDENVPKLRRQSIFFWSKKETSKKAARKRRNSSIPASMRIKETNDKTVKHKRDYSTPPPTVRNPLPEDEWKDTERRSKRLALKEIVYHV